MRVFRVSDRETQRSNFIRRSWSKVYLHHQSDPTLTACRSDQPASAPAPVKSRAATAALHCAGSEFCRGKGLTRATFAFPKRQGLRAQPSGGDANLGLEASRLG